MLAAARTKQEEYALLLYFKFVSSMEKSGALQMCAADRIVKSAADMIRDAAARSGLQEKWQARRNYKAAVAQAQRAFETEREHHTLKEEVCICARTHTWICFPQTGGMHAFRLCYLFDPNA